MSYLGNAPALAYTSFAKQDFTVTATTSYSLDHPVANENEIALFINFVRQEPTTSYSASGTTLTLTEATSSSDDMYCVYLGKAVQTVNPPNASVGASQIVDGAVTSAKLSYPLTTFSSTGIDDNATANALTIDSSSNLKFNSGYGSVATAYGVRAWVHFNGSAGAVSINESSDNVSSVAEIGTGNYNVNLSPNFVDGNYSAGAFCNNDGSGKLGSFVTVTATNYFRIQLSNGFGGTALRASTEVHGHAVR